MDKRIRILALVMVLLFGGVLVQAANVQFLRSHALAVNPLNPRNIKARLSTGRGDILAADGSVLATSVPTPKALYKYQRTYPLGSLMGHVTGFFSHVFTTSGIESQYNSYLVTHQQSAQSLSQVLSPTTSTDSVALTIEPKLQLLAAQQLAGHDGAIVAINPKTGSVEAMYSNPSYDPTPLASPSPAVDKFAWLAYNAPNAAGFAPLVSMATQRSFPPGSTFKVVTTTAVYNLRPDLATKVYAQSSSIPLPNSPLRLQNYGGEVCPSDPNGGTVAQLLPPSCDTGFAQLGLDLGASTLWAQAAAYGFDARPPLDLPGVAISNFPTPAQLKSNLPGLAYSAIGQEDVAATALQNALVVAGVANGGVVMEPHLMREIRDQQQRLIRSFSPKKWRVASTAQAATQVSLLMQQVVTQGTASGVFNPADKVAAKTGTAQTSATSVNQKTDDWMIAFAPADNPVIAIAVILPNQPLSATGAQVAGPVMNCMIEGALALAAGFPLINTSSTCPG